MRESTLRRLWLLARSLVEIARGLPVHLQHPEHGGSTLPRRLWEQARLLAGNGITAGDYYMYRLDRGDLPWERKREFLGSFDYWRWLRPFNPEAYHLFTEDKVVFKRFLAGAGCPVPRLLGVIGRCGVAETGHTLSSDAEVRRWLLETGVQHAVLKPVRGSRGTGVLVLGARAGPAAWERIPAGQIAVDEVIAHLRAYPHRPDFLVEERIRPHPGLAGFGDATTHSARLLTALDGGEAEVLAAALRIASGESAVDNFSQGNLAAPIDIETGRLGAAVFSKAAPGTRLRSHPMTGAPIEGFVVPDWDRALAVIRAAAQMAPFNRLLGWDVALAPGGPVILEANDLWDPDVSQIAPDRGLLATRLRAHLEREDALRLVGLGLGR